MTPLRLFRILRQRLRALFRRDSIDAELNQELAFHLEHLIQEFVERGLPLEDARHAARRAIGNIPSLEEQCRDHRSVTWIHDLRRDVTYGLRMLRKNPGFTLVAVLSLALGIGANTAVVSVLDGVFRGPSPIPDDERLVVLRTFPLDGRRFVTHATLSEYFAWRDASRSFETMGVSLGHNADFGADAGGAPAERINGQSMSPDAFVALGVRPIIGRVFTSEEALGDVPERVIVISHRLWQRRFGGRPDILDLQVRLDRVDRTVIGVMPEGFRYPSEVTDYWIPLPLDRSEFRGPRRFYVVTARLKPGVTIQQAQTELDVITTRLAREDPGRHGGWGVGVRPVRSVMFGWTVPPFLTLGAAVALVLLVACANLAGLLLARGLVRRPEMAVRTALGAARGRLVRQLLTESLLLSGAGGLLGVLVAWGGVRALVAMSPPPGGMSIADVSVSPRMLAVTSLVSILTGVAFGLTPALMTTRAEPTGLLKESPNGGGTGVRPPFRTALVAAQFALTVVLLVGSGLLTRSFVQLLSRDLQFDPDRLLTFELHTPLGDYLHRRGSVDGVPYFEIDPTPSLALERVYRGLQALPGVESVAGVSMPLLNSVVLHSATISVDAPSEAAGGGSIGGSGPALSLALGQARAHAADRRLLNAAYFLVTPGFFTSIKAKLIHGRDFSERDSNSSQWVAIVNESAALRFWPGRDPVGQRFRMPDVPDEREREVIGVVRDIPLSRQADPAPVLYASYLQQPARYPQPGSNMFGRMTLMIRTSGDPMGLLPAARRVVAGIDPGRPLASVSTMEGQLRGLVPQRGYVALATTAFALAAMLLSAMGIYGVMAYSVAQRTREIGIRVALGAGAREIVLLVGGRTMALVLVALSAGLAGSLMLTRLLQSQLWGVTPTDPVTFAAVIALLVLVALAAAFIPIRRATDVNPAVALRCE
jgi:putative ABC transport system permease protein